MDTRKRELTLFFQGHITRIWEDIVALENKNSGEALKVLLSQRVNKLKKHQRRVANETDCFVKYKVKTNSWLQGIKVRTCQHVSDLKIHLLTFGAGCGV
jgi:formate dehydrogenase assembly factor FdhD